MINYHIELVKALSSVLPTHYEMALTSQTETPCISYMETNNYVSTNGETLGYSVINYQVKVWGTKIAELQQYAQDIDNVLRPLGFERTNAVELYDPNSAMIQKVMTYKCLALENFN
ncbi:MAG: hypothetical protein IKY67_06615 [Paludibacteraceae bacterium]|nr:hypothetical protein [Paludibacteraceae bacterium]